MNASSSCSRWWPCWPLVPALLPPITSPCSTTSGSRRWWPSAWCCSPAWAADVLRAGGLCRRRAYTTGGAHRPSLPGWIAWARRRWLALLAGLVITGLIALLLGFSAAAVGPLPAARAPSPGASACISCSAPGLPGRPERHRASRRSPSAAGASTRAARSLPDLGPSCWRRSSPPCNLLDSREGRAIRR